MKPFGQRISKMTINIGGMIFEIDKGE